MKRSAPLLGAAIAFALVQSVSAADEPPAAPQSVQEKIDALQKQLDALKEELQRTKLTAQEQPRTTLNSNRETITSADGRSSIAFRAPRAAWPALADRARSAVRSVDHPAARRCVLDCIVK